MKSVITTAILQIIIIIIIIAALFFVDALFFFLALLFSCHRLNFCYCRFILLSPLYLFVTT